MAGTVILTGGIGSGKSAVAAMLRERGIPVYDSDSRTKALYDTVPTLVPSLEEALGFPLRDMDGKLDRKLLASIIFDNDEAREKLESIVYPLVRLDFEQWREAHADAPFLVFESAVVLSKPGFFNLSSRAESTPFLSSRAESRDPLVVLVQCSEEVRLERVMKRDSCSRQAALARIAAQEAPDLSLVDCVIDNSGSLEDLAREVDRVFPLPR